MQVSDTRQELQSNLTLWKKRMLNKIERIYKNLLSKYLFKLFFFFS